MKKSFFLFFAAILCAMTANAQWALMGTLTDWSSGKAMTVSGSTATCTVDLPGKTTYTLKVKNGGTWYGRNSTTISKTTTTSTFSTSEGDVTLNTDIPGTYTFSFNTSTKKLTVTYPTAPAPHDITVRAQVPAHWTNDIYAHVWTSENASGSDVGPLTKEGDYYVVTKNAGALYVIFKNGSAWSDKNQTVDLCYTEDVCLQINQSGTAKATATVIDCGAVAKDITVKAVVPGAWENEITAWVWPTGGEGKEVTPTKDGNWYVVTENCIELNVIFKNGKGWNGDENQTVNIEGVSENICYQISALNKVGNKCSVTEVDCEEAIEPEAKPVDVYTIMGASELGLSWDLAKTGNDMTKQTDGTYTLVKEGLDLATTGTYEYKVVKNHSWDWSIPSGNTNQTLKVDKDGTYTVTFTLSADKKKLTADTVCTAEKEVILDCSVAGTINLVGGTADFTEKLAMTYDEGTKTYSKTFTALAAGNYQMKVVYGSDWLGYDKLTKPVPANVTEGDDKKIKFSLAEAGDVTVTYHATNGIGLTGNFAVPETKYYIAGTENLTGFDWKENGLEMTKEGDVYKHTFSEKAAGTYEFKITNGTWTDPWGFSNLAANYVGVEQGKDGEGNPNGNIKIVTEEAKNIIVIFDPANNKITLQDWEEAAPAEPVTVYFINSGEWAEVACYYWGGIESSTWPGVQMTANGEVFEAEGWNVYAITFPGDNTKCIFTDNKATDAKQTADLEVQNGKYYCYANGIWYERLADVDLLDTRVYLKGEMNEWCANYCDMFRKETVDGTVAYKTLFLEEANTTYEFKIEDAGAWLSNIGTMTKDNCTGWTFEESVSDNAKITTEYVGEYTFVWDMTTKKLSVVYPELVPTVMDLMVTNMVFDGDNMTFSGSDNSYGIVFNLVVGDETEEEGVFALDASSTVDFGGTPFTDVTGMIAPDMSMGMPTAATAVVYGFLGGSEYFQFNLDMSAGGGTLVEILDGTASVDDATGELTISGNWDGDDVYVVAPGFEGVSYECPEVWFYVGGTTWETASIAAYGSAAITVDGNNVLVEGSVMSGVTGTQYELSVTGTFPEEETPNYTRTVTSGNYGTICLPFGGTITGAVLYECVGRETGKVYLGSVTTLTAGVPYIFQATATELAVYSDGTTATEAGNSNGLHGTFEDETEVAVGNYILLANTLRPSNGEAKVNANRAYLVMSEVPAGAPQQMPGRRYIGMSVQGENETTGVEDLFTTDTPVKVIENGQLIIIRDGVKYNVQGQKR